MSSLVSEIEVLLKATSTGCWIVTQEPAEVERELVALLTDPNEPHNALFTWDAHCGLSPLYQGPQISLTGLPSNARSPQGAIEMLSVLHNTVSGDASGSRVLLLHNFHKFLHLPDVMQGLANQLQAGKQSRTFAFVLSPSTQIPLELRTYLSVLHHELPNRAEIEQVMRELFPEETKGQEISKSLLDAAAGLTRYEAEDAFSRSIAEHRRLDPRAVWEYKAQTLAKDGTLSIYKGREDFNTLGGLQSVKKFCFRCLTEREGRISKPKGIIALGVGGCGKSQFAKVLGNTIGRPTLVLDLPAHLSKYVGESEGKFQKTLHTLEAVAPVICFIDEVEKGLAGAGSGMDSGVIDHLLSMYLSWRQDTKADVFTIMTSNDISKLPAPFIRAGRTNAIFFFDLPDRQEKDSIWPMFLQEYKLEDEILPDDTNWTGAEIRNCCELAEQHGLSLQEAAEMVVPIATTSKNQIDELRAWADGRVLSASVPGIYRRSADQMPTLHKPKAAKRRNLKPGNENFN